MPLTCGFYLQTWLTWPNSDMAILANHIACCTCCLAANNFPFSSVLGEFLNEEVLLGQISIIFTAKMVQFLQIPNPFGLVTAFVLPANCHFSSYQKVRQITGLWVLGARILLKLDFWKIYSDLPPPPCHILSSLNHNESNSSSSRKYSFWLG